MPLSSRGPPLADEFWFIGALWFIVHCNCFERDWSIEWFFVWIFRIIISASWWAPRVFHFEAFYRVWSCYLWSELLRHDAGVIFVNVVDGRLHHRVVVVGPWADFLNIQQGIMTHKIYLILINYSHHSILISRETISHSQNKARVADARGYLEWLPCHQYRYVGVCLAVEEDRCLFGYAGMKIFKTFIKLFIVFFPFLDVVFFYSGH